MEYNLVARWRPSSVVAEQYRVAATRLVLLGRERRNTVMVVTSAVKGEGKSTTSINLAYVLARDLGKSTLIIDCDLKRPVLHTYASVGSEPGLAEVLRGENHLDACLHGMGELPLWILPAGSTEDKPVELGKVHLLAELLPQLRKRFEFIILDAPPILPLADMNVLASMADVMTLVVRAEVTRRDVVQKALATLKPTNQVGVVVTGLWTNQMPYYMQEYYYARERASQHAA
jgi:capsular exopolysaccharide synthesis family protein